MTLSDLKKASAARQEQESPATNQNQSASKPSQITPAPTPEQPRASTRSAPVTDGRTKMLGARVPLSVHREFQQQIFRAQEDYPDLTMQEAVPALIRLLRDDTIWAKFLAELEEG